MREQSTETTRRASLSRVPKVQGEAREVLAEHRDEKQAARLVRVETGGTERRTGKPETVYYEATAKAPGQLEVVSMFSAERNARIAFQ